MLSLLNNIQLQGILQTVGIGGVTSLRIIEEVAKKIFGAHFLYRTIYN